MRQQGAEMTAASKAAASLPHSQGCLSVVQARFLPFPSWQRLHRIVRPLTKSDMQTEKIPEIRFANPAKIIYTKKVGKETEIGRASP